MADNLINYSLDPDNEVETVMDAFRLMFDPEQISMLFTKNVRKGPTSDLIYIPKGMNGKVATVIIWNGKEKYYINGEVKNGRQIKAVQAESNKDGSADKLGI